MLLIFDVRMWTKVLNWLEPQVFWTESNYSLEPRSTSRSGARVQLPSIHFSLRLLLHSYSTISSHSFSLIHRFPILSLSLSSSLPPSGSLPHSLFLPLFLLSTHSRKRLTTASSFTLSFLSLPLSQLPSFSIYTLVLFLLWLSPLFSVYLFSSVYNPLLALIISISFPPSLLYTFLLSLSLSLPLSLSKIRISPLSLTLFHSPSLSVFRCFIPSLFTFGYCVPLMVSGNEMLNINWRLWLPCTSDFATSLCGATDTNWNS